jgi:stringent starvation protein B
MRSSRPYLIRALYEWVLDNQLTPYILVNAEIPGVDVPRQHVEDGKIILNIATHAIQNLNISNQAIEFDASFAGKPTNVYAPIKAILAIYARENGRGMVFNEEEEETDNGTAENEVAPQPVKYTHKPRKPKLTIVK